jgi:hypothetical protein
LKQELQNVLDNNIKMVEVPNDGIKAMMAKEKSLKRV